MTPPHPDFDYFARNEAGEKSNRLLPPQLAGCVLGFEVALRRLFARPARRALELTDL
jgi:hypothetical protein